VRYRFGDCELDEDTRQLWRAGVDVHLGPKAFDFLVLLIRARPRVLSKAELHASLWPDSFVSDASLATLAAEIRGALDERAARSRWIRTVHRRGYAFPGTVTPVEAPAAPAVAVADTSFWLQAELRQIGLRGAEHLVGRDPHAQVWLDDSTVSRRHARLTIDGDRISVEDLGSKNGTFVQGTRIDAPTTLADGDHLRFGSVEVTFRVWTAAASTKSARSTGPRAARVKRRR
jgi:DNA-binding winged helix-turn-helix (wHTH) protein